MIAKAQWNDESEIVCYHGFQSFKHGEVTPEIAHEVGVKLAERMWGDRFQVVVVFDGFMGTGSTALAAIMNGRSYLGAEISGDYYALAQKRIKEVSENGGY